MEANIKMKKENKKKNEHKIILFLLKVLVYFNKIFNFDKK